MTPTRPLRIGFLHPELGLGGSERLVVDAAVELQRRGHVVSIFTTAHDPARAFPETHDGTLEVEVRGSFLPTRIAGRFQAACSVLRMSWAAIAMARADRFDVIVSDLVPYGVPVLRALGRTKLVYYCHYPDQLLAPPRRGLYRLYRLPLDHLEVPAMRAADCILVNSRYTARVLAGLGGHAEVVYPGVDVAAYADVPPAPPGEAMFLLIGRFDPRKNLPLAVAALARLRELAPAVFATVRMVIAGGLDPNRPEDGELAASLERLGAELGVADRLVLVRSPSEAERLTLLGRCLAVVHAATDEHFGLVPVEAMAAARPVIACNTAGPLETIVDGTTGFLCQPAPDAFAGAMLALARDRDRARAMGHAARIHATDHFSRRAFGDALESQLLRLVSAGSA